MAEALRLDKDERDHLFRLARPQKPRDDPGGTFDAPRPGVRQLLDWITAPALVLGRRMDVLAWNRAASALITDFAELPRDERNLAYLHLLHPEIGPRYPDVDVIAREVVGHLRVAAGRFPEDPELWRLVDELTTHCEEFRRHWESHIVRTKSYGVKRVDHPEAGPLTLSYEITHFPQDPEQTLLVYTAAPGSPEEKTLQAMAKG